MFAISIIALTISCLALPFTMWAARATARQADAARAQTQIQRQQVDAAREQTQLQRELAEAASQPYVWVDIQPDMQQGSMLQVVVGNSGPTVASNVKVTFDPPLPAGSQHAERIAKVQRTLSEGLRSLAPQRVIRWSIGSGRDLLSADDPQVRAVRIEVDGPHGALPIREIQIDISQWRDALDAPDGSLHHVRRAVNELTTAVQKVNGTIERATNHEE